MPGDTLVRDVMSSNLVTVEAESSVEDAADLLSERSIDALPVVDGSGKLLGLLRDDDLIASEARVHVPTFINFLGLGVPMPGEMKHLEKELKKIAGATVGDVMQTDPPTVTGEQTLSDVASLLHEHGVTSIPVVDDAGKVVGIVARGDLVRDIARNT
jgi:CBS domain-containing protein